MQTQSSFKTTETGTLFLVPTPIGNLGDMTYRAIDTLKSVALIAAEDTRNTQKLLNHFEIETKQISFHEHNTQQRIETLIEKLEAASFEKDVASFAQYVWRRPQSHLGARTHEEVRRIHSWRPRRSACLGD